MKGHGHTWLSARCLLLILLLWILGAVTGYVLFGEALVDLPGKF